VDETGTALPAVFAWLEERGMAVETAGEFKPPFDDVFVTLLERETEQQNREQSYA
jgi:hypothetical protein